MQTELEICEVKKYQWIRELGQNYSPFDVHYSSHEAYSNYPVVNISFEAAKLYCKWLTDNDESKKYTYRLPTKMEWIYAAKGGLALNPYSWGTGFLRDKKNQPRCNYKSIGDEFIHTDNDENYSVILEYSPDHNSTEITTPIESYSRNDYGLYNMCGNVAEMIEKEGVAMGGSWNSTGYDVRVVSEYEYETPTPFVGFRPVRVLKSK